MKRYRNRDALFHAFLGLLTTLNDRSKKLFSKFVTDILKDHDLNLYIQTRKDAQKRLERWITVTVTFQKRKKRCSNNFKLIFFLDDLQTAGLMRLASL